MPAPAKRLRALIAGLAAIATAALAAVFVASAAASGPAHRRAVARCERLILGLGDGSARAVRGSADPQVAAELSIFRATRSGSDTLPAASNLGQALRDAAATTYDPSASVRLDVRGSTNGPVYAVPVMLAAPTVPARCQHIRGLAPARAISALKTEETGTGAGVCLVSVSVIRSGLPRSILPGRRPPRKGHSRTVANTGCESLGILSSYLGMFGGGMSSVAPRAVLVPDGVSSLAYTFADGRQIVAPVSRNFATLPAAQSQSVPLHKLVTRAQLTREFTARAPVSVTEEGAAGTAVASFSLPPSLIPALVKEALLLERSIKLVNITGSEQVFAKCSAQTHRCVAAVVSTSCNASRHRCTIKRRIRRYRYGGRRPPRGTTGRVDVPRGPIRARLSRYITRPGKVNLVLGGEPHHRVDVLVATACFAPHGATASGADRPLHVAVPSRTPIATVRHRPCAVNVLVASAQPGPIHARLVRG